MTENTKNLLVNGMTGTGKSPALIRHLAQRISPINAVWALDIKTTDASEILAQLNALIAARSKASTGDEPPIVLVVDESQVLLADPAVAATVADLIRLGRQAGIGAVEGGQR